MSRVRANAQGIQEMVKGATTWRALEEVANGIAERVHAPSHLRVWVKRGISSTRREAFAQVIMEGSGALTEEFGNRSRPANAPLRRAMRGGR